MIARLVCWWKGHKRGVRVDRVGGELVDVPTFRCPRCRATWTRKEKRAAQA